LVGLPADFHNHFLFLTSVVIDLPWPYFFSRILQRDILDFLSPTDISCAHAGGLFHFRRRRCRLPRPRSCPPAPGAAPGGAGASTPARPPPPPPDRPRRHWGFDAAPAPRPAGRGAGREPGGRRAGGEGQQPSPPPGPLRGEGGGERGGRGYGWGGLARPAAARAPSAAALLSIHPGLYHYI